MEPKNLIIIMADEHNRKALGCYGHPIAKTPNIDKLALTGARFTSAYTPSPLCVPARAAFATGKPVREIGAWDNAHPYTGNIESWHHRLRANGHHVRSIGKLHFRGLEGDDNGFSQTEIPMNIVDGIGDALGLIRDRNIERGAADKMANLSGPGETDYTRYDRDISARAQIWLREEATQITGKPWVLFISFVSPHFPLTAPPEQYYRYRLDNIPMPKLYDRDSRPDHPYLRDYAATFAYDRFFKSEQDVKRALAGYFGLCSFIDDQVGAVMRAVDESGLRDDTRIIYTSDHGDNLGARGLWGKTTMYEESVGIPLIVTGPGISGGEIRTTPRSLIDLPRFILESTGSDAEGFGEVDLFSDDDPPVISEYHGTGSRSAAFMLRHKQWKYVHYEAYEPQLFNLESDHEELNDLAGDARYSGALKDCRALLFSMLDPSDVHRQAIDAQKRRITELGGVDGILERGDFGFSPPPGKTATYSATKDVP